MPRPARGKTGGMQMSEQSEKGAGQTPHLKREAIIKTLAKPPKRRRPRAGPQLWLRPPRDRFIGPF